MHAMATFGLHGRRRPLRLVSPRVAGLFLVPASASASGKSTTTRDWPMLVSLVLCPTAGWFLCRLCIREQAQESCPRRVHRSTPPHSAGINVGVKLFGCSFRVCRPDKPPGSRDSHGDPTCENSCSPVRPSPHVASQRTRHLGPCSSNFRSGGGLSRPFRRKK